MESLMKTPRLLLWLPLGLLVLIFALDKLALVPVLREAGRSDPTPNENIIHNMRALYRKAPTDKPVLAIFGSSRSDIFKFLAPEEIERGLFLSPAEKRRMQALHFETRSVIRASELFLTYTLIENMLRERKPDLIVLEVSPEMFNKHSPFSMNLYIRNHVYDRPILRAALGFTSGDLRLEVIARLLFATYAYRWRPERAVMNLIAGERAADEGRFVAQLLLDQQKNVEPIPEDYREYPEGDIPIDVFEERFQEYTDFLERSNILMNYRNDPDELRTLSAILELCKERGVPVVVWIPYVHPVLSRRWATTEYPELHPRVVAAIEAAGVPFFRGFAAKMECRRFVDSSHLSGRCAPYLMSRILETAVTGHGPAVLKEEPAL